ncbi:ABC transporter ATP-binding protein [Azotobacter beijerinckii]|uniref:ABC-type cobalamin/Fe3+-siderophores transport system, ATPase component n=1 Tax=Azotobacter beijerinckii TaxID=170623 RepID=A0A1I4HKS0_9GAMM|nr:ABC transporter ATP-binding protein [Azotobacter beijerinckii]SFB61864.1 ABC-type cobalamin/Fe3+-siderophores transport system, ATPase component [Azotobacter beijerinckii]SFL42317.1 ABC-type cobalamin/Fe3+-siderophores transport system, ATPase component [Azotobacter beijerinckii]
MLEAHALACGYGCRTILDNLSFTLAAGELLCLLGPNGVGKTTLFKTLLGLLPPRAGEIRLDGKATRHWPRRQFARQVGYVPQAHTPPFPFLVEDVVAMGRTAHGSLFSGPSPHDREIAGQSLETLGIAALARTSYTEISGGERQLVLIARALAQEPRILVMDEPTSNLDYGNQLKVMAHVRRIADAGRMGIVLTTHHPNHALLHASRLRGCWRWTGKSTGASAGRTKSSARTTCAGPMAWKRKSTTFAVATAALPASACRRPAPPSHPEGAGRIRGDREPAAVPAPVVVVGTQPNDLQSGSIRVPAS